VFSASIYDYVNVAKDPQLQYTVLAGLLNVASCPSCGRRAAIARPFVYSDPAHRLLVYAHPHADIPEETRSLLQEKLRTVYVNSVNAQAATLEQQLVNGQKQHEEVPGNGAAETHKQQTPPLQVVFGLDQLYELINTALSQDERLGRLALSTHSRSDAERGQLLTIARKLASEMQCQIEVENMPDEYTVWLYGSRRQIGALMRELAPRG